MKKVYNVSRILYIVTVWREILSADHKHYTHHLAFKHDFVEKLE